MKPCVSCATLLALIASAPVASSLDPELVGCWRSDTVTSYLADGTGYEGKAQCSLRFTDTTIESACLGDQGPFRITYSYNVVAPGKYEAEIRAHSGLPGAVGSKRLYEYRTDGDGLLITTYPQTTSPAPLNQAVKVVSSSTRNPGGCGEEIDD